MDACHYHLSRARWLPSSSIAVINTWPAFGSSSLLDVGHSHPAPLGRALRDYGHYYPVHGEDVLDPTPFAAHSHSGLGPTPTLLIRHPCTRNKIVRYFEFLSNQRSHNCAQQKPEDKGFEPTGNQHEPKPCSDVPGHSSNAGNVCPYGSRLCDSRNASVVLPSIV